MSADAARPDPDAVLRRVSASERREARGALKVFLGFAPGVGKTYRMLAAACEASKRGVSVVVGIAETHERAETEALLRGLEALPRRRVAYRGQTLKEFDLDAALARKARLILVDELAHTNAPGSRHAKRYQDVEELLNAGVDVWTTLNVQHLESLADVVEQITGVLVRESIPDRVLDLSDEVELVDLPPEKLIERLREGKVYGADPAVTAERNFFRPGNLMALRELALRRTAERVDADVRAYRAEHAILDTWRASDRILVCAGPAPASATVVRGARRLAAGLRAPWSALYVESPMVPLNERDRRTLEDNLSLAERLGAEVVRISSPDIAAAILDHARRHHVTKILVGKPTHPRLRDRLRGSLLDALVRGSGDIDVHVVSGEVEARGRPGARVNGLARRGAVAASALVAAATVAGIAARDALGLPDSEMLYFVAIMIAAAVWGRAASVLAAALSVLAFDLFFVPPHFTLAVADRRYAMTFLMMFAVGLVISTLTSRLRAQEHAARTREGRTRAFYSLARDLGAVESRIDIARTLSLHVAVALEADTAFVQPKEVVCSVPESFKPGTDDLAVARWVQDNGRPAGRGTDTLPAAASLCVPLRHGGRHQGVLAVRFRGSVEWAGEREVLLDGLARLGAMALARADLAEEARTTLLRARAEEMRSALLSGVSHDLRTPLATITGAATTLRHHGAALAEEQKNDLLEAICEESRRLDRLAANLLDMTRLQSGSLSLRREWIPLEEIVGSALHRLEFLLDRREVSVRLRAGLPLLCVDPVVFEQVFVNLLENAAKYTPSTAGIEIRAEACGGQFEIDVADDGPGIPAEDRERVFGKFYRGPSGQASGFGLGLPLCRGIVEAHGGSLVLVASDRGARFRISLPLKDAPPLAALAPGA